MLDFLFRLFETQGFPPRWECGTWTEGHGWLHILSDIGIWGAYMAIPSALAYFIIRRRDIPFTNIFWLFCAFIFSCGTSHLIEAFIFWWPAYRFLGVVKLFTAIVSWMTFFALLKVTPLALNLPGLAVVNAKLEAEIKARNEMEERLVRTMAELDEFTYIASHDLQEPLHKMSAFCDLLRKDLGGDLPERAERDITFITEASKRMQALVRELLLLSKAGRVQLKQEEVSLDLCVNQAIDALSLRIQEASAVIQRDPLPEVHGDRTLLVQLYQNLISNAIKYRRELPVTVHITAENIDGKWIFGVRDNGIGIKSEYFDQIFQPFKRLHGQSEYEGAGIGLAICKKVVERHGGKIWVESEQGEGSHFKFTLHD